MKLILFVLLFFIYRRAQGAGEDKSAELDEMPNIDYKKPLELAAVNEVFILPPPENQRPPNMEVSKYCRLGDVNYNLSKQEGWLTCLTKTSDRTVSCRYDIRPKSVPIVSSPCGQGALVGARYTFQYDVCVLNATQTSIKQKLYTVLFSICYNKTKRQTFYTQHKIASNTYNPRLVLDPKSYMERFAKSIIRQSPLEFGNIAEAYQKILNDPQLNNLDSPDYLIPQTLLPATDFDPDYARGAHLTWTIVRPQYASLSGAWNSLNKIIWYKFHDPTLRVKIYTGTAGNLVVRGKERTIRVFEVDKTTSEISVPYIWWKAMKTNDAFFIVMFYNVPSGYLEQTITPRCTDRENNPATEQHCADILTKLEGKEGLHIECCSLTETISKEMNLDAEVLNPPKTDKPSTSSIYVPPQKRK